MNEFNSTLPLLRRSLLILINKGHLFKLPSFASAYAKSHSRHLIPRKEELSLGKRWKFLIVVVLLRCGPFTLRTVTIKTLPLVWRHSASRYVSYSYLFSFISFYVMLSYFVMLDTFILMTSIYNLFLLYFKLSVISF